MRHLGCKLWAPEIPRAPQPSPRPSPQVAPVAAGTRALSHLPAHSLGSAPSLLRIQKGGVASGMKQVETNSYQVQRLLHVKGKRNVVAGEVGISQGPSVWPPVLPTHSPPPRPKCWAEAQEG